jgi:hypothetical protein
MKQSPPTPFLIANRWVILIYRTLCPYAIVGGESRKIYPRP